jgi:hypothetical protein
MALRRWHARRLLPEVRDRWPVLESAGAKPPGWNGWPENRQFALVLTHDVESRAGLEQVKPLAEIEMQHGFRSSFNFIPEGEYQADDQLRRWLVSNGFEVGVHDLYHDGKLYVSHELFQKHAQGINGYLKAWNAVGFRSGFMHHQLEWLHDLEILYDMSTFDTDPFERQPDHVDTIFPFFVPNPALKASGFPDVGARRGGYYELPYTLPQDSTLFLLLGEKDAGIWCSKTTWIASRGGMVLINTHPDYMRMESAMDGRERYPVARYVEFLRFLNERCRGQYWMALPRDVAGWLAGQRGGAPAKANPAVGGQSQ